MLSLRRLIVLPFIVALSAWNHLVLTYQTCVDYVLTEEPCSMAKLKAELAFNKQNGSEPQGTPRRRAKTRNDAGYFVSFLKAVNPIALA